MRLQEIERMLAYLSKQGVYRFCNTKARVYELAICLPDPDPKNQSYDIQETYVDFEKKTMRTYYAMESGHNGDHYSSKWKERDIAEIDGFYDVLLDKMKACAKVQAQKALIERESAFIVNGIIRGHDDEDL